MNEQDDKNKAIREAEEERKRKQAETDKKYNETKGKGR
jgi:hypothetical protein